MTAIKIKTFKDEELLSTITVPLKLFKTISKFVPKEALAQMEVDGIDIREIILSTEDDFCGVIAEIENHKKNKKVVISIE